MAYVVAGVSGNTGGVVASTLIAAGKKVRVIVRDAAKGEPWRAKGAEVALAELDDAAALEKAIAGAEGVYLLRPPTAVGAATVEAIAAAIGKANPAHVVFLSSIGAQHASGNGPIAPLHVAEKLLGPGKVPITFVRPAYFMENWASVAALAQGQGILPSFLTAGQSLPQVATADIGRVAAEALLEGPRGHHVIELEGPVRYTPEEVAATFAKVLGKPVQLTTVPPAGWQAAFEQAGLPAAVASVYAEMYAGIANGTVDFARPNAVKGKVTLEETVRKLVGAA